MPRIVEYPQGVQEALRDFDDLVAKDCPRRHCAEYLTGRYGADRKKVRGIHREFAPTTDPSCLNRFMTAADGDSQAIHPRRLDLLPKDPATRYRPHGVIARDNVLIDQEGLLIPDVSGSWDHAEDRSKIAQDSILINDVGTHGKLPPGSSAASAPRAGVTAWATRLRTPPPSAARGSIGSATTRSRRPSPSTAPLPTPPS